MLWVAAGRRLPERLTSAGDGTGCLTAKGWAIESRVYAEDPLRNFLPSIGPLVTYIEPVTGPAVPIRGPTGTSRAIVRIDTGVCEGGAISTHYDPMIAKLCTHAPTRLVSQYVSMSVS